MSPNSWTKNNCRDSALKTAFLPFAASNPYQEKLAAALHPHGVHVDKTHQCFPSVHWLLHNRNKTPILHIHWPHTLYRHGRQTLKKASGFLGGLVLARMLGYKIVWTAHNLMPHETPDPWLDRWVRRMVLRTCHNVFVHCDNAAIQLKGMFRSIPETTTIPHGNFKADYPDGLARSKARKLLGIQDKVFVYLFFGQIRPYKNIGMLMAAFKQLPGDNVLVVAGGCRPDEQKRLEAVIAGNPAIRFFPSYIPGNRTHLFFSAADVFVAPFEHVLTSGSVILSLSYGLPVIAPARGCLPELLSRGGGALYHENSPKALAEAMQKIKRSDLKRMNREADEIASGLSWKTCAARTSRVYRQLAP